LSESIVESNTRDAINIRPSDTQTPAATAAPMRARLNTYTSYSIGCAGVWGVILLLAQRQLNSQARNTLQLAAEARSAEAESRVRSPAVVRPRANRARGERRF
jgi:hypothetical protein